MIGQSCGHGRSALLADVPFAGRRIAHRTEFVMRPTEVIDAAQQIHPSV